MDTVTHIVEGIELIMPVWVRDYAWPNIPLEQFKHCCGSGDGIGDLIVPEKILGMKVSHVCYIHDRMWDLAEASWTDFHASNSVFLHNLIETIVIKSNSPASRRLRLEQALNYYTAVDTVGARIFWKQKHG